MSAVVRPFAFAAEFRDPGRGPVTLEALELENEELRRQLAEARQRGLAEGRSEALVQLHGERDTALLAAASALSLSLGSLAIRFDEVERKVARLGAELALDLADHLAARALERDPAAAIDEAIGRALGQVRRDCPLRVRVAPALVAAIEAMIEERERRDCGLLQVIVIADPALTSGDARVEWDDGALVLDRAARHAMMSAEIASTLAR